MKFLNGYWLLRDGVERLLHVDYYDCNVGVNDIALYASSRKLTGRSDTINTAVLTTKIAAVADDILRIDTYHHRGYRTVSPDYCPTGLVPDDFVVSDCFIRSGGLEAEIVDDTLRFSFMGKKLFQREPNLSGYYTLNDNAYMVEYMQAGIGETFYGLGERFSPFARNGQSVEIWNEDGGTASDQSYKNIPFIISSNGYGILVASYGLVSFEIETEAVEDVQFSVPGECISYYVFAGRTMTDVLMRYASLTGKPALPPKWSFGLWLSTSFTTDYDEKTVMSFIDGMSERGIPLSVFHFDCFWMDGLHWMNFEWNKSTFPDPKGMIERIHDKGIRVCVWINPYFSQNSILFEEGVKNGFFLRKTNGDVWQWDLWQPGMAIVDFTNPDAVSWYCFNLKRLVDLGVDCFKTDFGERIPCKDVCWHDGSDPSRMHNYYSILYNNIVFDFLASEKKADAVVFARSSSIGGQRFPVHWGGDCSASYLSMAETLRGGLSLALCAFGFWSHDIGGFEDTATPDLFKRWIAFGAFSTHSRLHGSSSYRVPWFFDDEASAVTSFFMRLKQSLMPYIVTCAGECCRTGIPVMRPMILEFPDDETVKYIDRQYMFGPSLLVAPVMSPDGCCRFYLPAGRWHSFFDGSIESGPCWKTGSYGYFSLPLYARDNSSIEMEQNGKRILHIYGNIDADEKILGSYDEVVRHI